jgi:apolipoprotein D and lipocalin family protein
LLLGAGVLIAGCAFARPVGNPRVPQPAKPVDLIRYLGRWYEIARYDAGFERGCEAATADYALRPDGLIRVVNACRMGRTDGRVRSVDGKAKVIEGSGNAKLKVSFFGPFFIGDYWVLDHADDYTWSIVGEPRGQYLWLLCRDATPPDAVRDMLVERARALGYDTGMLRMTRQPPG